MSRIVWSSRVSRMPLAIVFACAASFHQVTEFSIADFAPVVPVRAKPIGRDAGIVTEPIRIFS